MARRVLQGLIYCVRKLNCTHCVAILYLRLDHLANNVFRIHWGGGSCPLAGHRKFTHYVPLVSNKIVDLAELLAVKFYISPSSEQRFICVQQMLPLSHEFSRSAYGTQTLRFGSNIVAAIYARVVLLLASALIAQLNFGLKTAHVFWD